MPTYFGLREVVGDRDIARSRHVISIASLLVSWVSYCGSSWTATNDGMMTQIIQVPSLIDDPCGYDRRLGRAAKVMEFVATRVLAEPKRKEGYIRTHLFYTQYEVSYSSLAAIGEWNDSFL